MKNNNDGKSGGKSKTAAVFLGFFLFQQLITPSLFAVTVRDQVLSETQNGRDEGLENKSLENARTETATRSAGDEMQDKSTVVVADKIPYKDPRLACILSFIIPGGGEFYLRKDIKGVAFCLSTTAAYLLSFYFLYQGLLVGGSDAKSKLIAGGVGSIAAIVLHIVGMLEAYNDAVDLNEARYYYSE